MKPYFKAGAHVHILSNPTPFIAIGIPFQDWENLYHKIPFYTILEANELNGWITLKESLFIFNETCFEEYYDDKTFYEEISTEYTAEALQALCTAEEDIAGKIFAAIEKYRQKSAPPKKETTPELKHITHPRTPEELKEWDEYTALLKEFYSTHDKSTPPPIMTGKTGIYSLRPIISRKEFQETNQKRGWNYHE